MTVEIYVIGIILIVAFILELIGIFILLKTLDKVNYGLGGGIHSLGNEIIAIREHLEQLSALVPNVNLITNTNPIVDIINAFRSMNPSQPSYTDDSPQRDELGRFAEELEDATTKENQKDV